MKKLVKLLAAIGTLSLLFSFAACDIPTESELLGNNNKIIVEDPNVKTPGEVSNGGLWSMLDGADMQMWSDPSGLTAELEETSEGLKITVIGNENWWGMCFCNNAATDVAAGAVTFDMSKITKITFEAKASENASMWVSQSNAQAKVTNQKKIDLTTQFETKTFTLSNPGTKDYGVLDIGGGDLSTTVKKDLIIVIKNIKFFDANGNETVPSRNE